MSTDTSRVSPTAHYTGYVWYRNGMSYDAFKTDLGVRLYRLLQPFNAVYKRVSGRPNLEMTLLARHRVIDHMLTEAIEAGQVSQVVEIAGGLSPRGATFARRYRDRGLVYIEGDLPDMVAHKRALLESAGMRADNHHIVEINALVDDGPVSLGAVAGEMLDERKGTAIITEGLTGYFSPSDLQAMWRRFSTTLGRYRHGVYWADIMVRDEAHDIGTRAFKRALGWFAKGSVYLHWDRPADAEAALRDCGFAQAVLHPPRAFPSVDVPAPDLPHLVRLIEARV